jgi:hypothetical protein
MMQKAFILVFFLFSIFGLRGQERKSPPPSAGAQTPSSGTQTRSAGIHIREDTLDLPGQEWQLDPQGLPGQIRFFYIPSQKEHPPAPTDLLAENIHFHVTRQSDGKDIHLTSGGLVFTMRDPDTVRWRVINSSDEWQMEVEGTLSSDGQVSFDVTMTAFQDLALKELAMHIPFQKEFGKYMEGLGTHGSLSDTVYIWKWADPALHRAVSLIGNDSTGLLFQLSCSCGDRQKGGIAVGIKGRSMLLNQYCGGSAIRKGDILSYRFQLRIRPYH